MEGPICSHYMYGYCKFKNHCPKQHVNIICPKNQDCEDNGCIYHHPKACRYFEKNSRCKFDDCAYSHVKEGNTLKIEILENQVTALKHEIEEIKKICQEKLDHVAERLQIIEQKHSKQSEEDSTLDETPPEVANEKEKNISIVVETDTRNETKVNGAESEPEKLKCNKCNFISNKKITMNKHKNTKHTPDVSQNECSLCEDIFGSEIEYKKHIEEHIEEIENIDIASLTNGHDLFECNLCSFESGLGDSIREHMIDHVNPQRHDESESAADVVKAPYQSLLDEYDEDGNYIGNNPKYMD